jgi:hypothetical protein
VDDMNRRDFMAAALGGMALLGGAGVSGLDRVLAPGDADPALAVLLRRNVYCLNDSSPQIVAYRNAITAMQALPATNPASWLAQANIHGTFSPPPGMITDACQHSSGATNLFFLSWHRMYLYYFERIVRQQSGDASFALPYWGYSPSSTARRVLPAMFRTPATAANKLFVSQRRATVNSGSALSASSVDPGAALLQLSFSGFSGGLEGTPHGVVHTGVGGAGGWMSAFETAGQDPIFWLHHAMVDRLWSVWLAQGGGRANPGTASWLTTNFQFYDANGSTVSMSGQQVVDTATQLSYNYASTSCFTIVRPPVLIWRELTLIPPWDPRALELSRIILRRPPLPDPPPEITVQQGLRLGQAQAQARIPVTAETKRALTRLADRSAQGPSNVSLVLEDIRLDQPAEVYYEVYVNLPANERPVYTSPSYVGNLDFFGPSPQGKHRDMPLRRSLSILPAYVRLRASGRWSDDEEIRVTFVPRGYTDDEAPARVLKERPQATIGRVALRIE